MRARDSRCAVIGDRTPGPLNAITDVAGVRVGHTPLVEGDGPLRVGAGPVRAGVTVIVPHDGDIWEEPLFAGSHRLNGNGELTGLEWVHESSGRFAGPSESPTVTASEWCATLSSRPRSEARGPGEAVLESARGGRDLGRSAERRERLSCDRRARARRVAPRVCGRRRGGQRGRRRGDDLPRLQGWRRDGLPRRRRRRRRLHGRCARPGQPRAARALGYQRSAGGAPDHGRGGPRCRNRRRRGPEPGRVGAGSIIAIVATDAPLLPVQCGRLAQRVGLGVARLGGTGEHWSGDLFFAFSTANRGMPACDYGAPAPRTVTVTMLTNTYIDTLFDAVVEATEEAIVNALLAAETMVGRDGVTAWRLRARPPRGDPPCARPPGRGHTSATRGKGHHMKEAVKVLTVLGPIEPERLGVAVDARTHPVRLGAHLLDRAPDR